jgi:hypothetical protein
MQDMTFVIGPERAAAEIWEVLGSVGITMEASCTFPTVAGRNVRVVVRDEDADMARNALLDAGFGAVDRHEVLIADIEVAPGGLGRLARRVAYTGAKLTTLYMATGDRVVIGADDLDKVRAII